jgi:hypothetical protein
VKKTIPHKSLAMGQSKNRCRIDSCPAQKKHLVHPFVANMASYAISSVWFWWFITTWSLGLTILF